MLSLDEYAEMLAEFGLTRNQAKVYIAVDQLGFASVSQVSKASKVRREDVYRIMPKLEKMGLIEKILGTPMKIRATPVEEALSLLIKREQDAFNKKVSVLMSKKDAFLKHFTAYKKKPSSDEEKPHFALISKREGIINREMNMIENAEREIDLAGYEFYKLFTNYDELLKKALMKGVKVRIVLDISEHNYSIQGIIEEYTSSGASFDLKYTDQPSSQYMIVDYKQALVATSTEPHIGENHHLWTDDNNLVELMQQNFEGIWHASVNQKAIETNAVAEKATHFIKQLRPTNHVVLMYESLEVKYNVLFNYLKVGLEDGEAAVYIATEETPSDIRDAMKRFGIEVEKYEKTGALHILGCNEFYIIEGKFDISTTIGLLNKLYKESFSKGFKGCRVAGEMACFFEHNLIRELIDYERALHRVFDIPVIAICSYNTNMFLETNNPINVYTELVRAHGTVLFTGIDNTLGKIQIRKD